MTNSTLKELWEEYPHIWATQSAFFVWLRGSLRRAVWNTYPIKIEVIKESSVPKPDGYNGKAKKFAKCSLTGKVIPKSQCQVDHIVGNASLQSWNDLLPFVKHLCATKDNLQIVSKEAHKIKSYAERHKISFEDACDIKEAIAIMKSKKDKQWLSDHKVIPANNAKRRRQQIIKILCQERSNKMTSS